jgi:hypothetical protein
VRKIDEIENPDSCLNRAGSGEMIFVLRATDPSAPTAILSWIMNRVQLGRNKFSDEKIKEALRCIETMERTRDNMEE